jgi:uncharacterized protein YabE (DUF348 family)
MVPVATFLVLFFFAIVLFINQNGQVVGASDSRIVELSLNGQTQTIPTTATTVGDLLKRINVTLNPGDVVEPSAGTPILQNGFQINVYRVHPVTVVENGNKTVVLTADNDPRAIAQQAGYTLYPEDIVTTAAAPDNLNQNVLGNEVVVKPSTPVSLTLYGQQVIVRTQAKTVGELLADKQIKTSSGNNVLPALTTPISANMQILVVPVGQKLSSTQQVIPFPTQNTSDSNIPIGSSKVEQNGVNGLALVVTDLVTAANGTTSSQTLQQVVINQPVPEIIGHGTGVALSAGGNNVSWLKSSQINPSDYSYADFIMSHESHWNPAAVNSRGCIGLGQSCSPSALASFCTNWQVDAVCQLDFFNNYVTSHNYGTWANAYSFWVSHGYW